MCWKRLSPLSNYLSELSGFGKEHESDDPDFNYFDIKWSHEWSVSQTNVCEGQGYIIYDEEWSVAQRSCCTEKKNLFCYLTFHHTNITVHIETMNTSINKYVIVQLLLANKVNEVTLLPTITAPTVAPRHTTEGLCPFEFRPTSAAVILSLWAALIFPTLLLRKHSWLY